MISAEPDPDLIALDEALNYLEKLDSQKCLIVELRYFGGRTIEETAEILDLSTDKVKSEWRAAKIVLRKRLGGK